MRKEEIEELLDEYSDCASASADPALRLVDAALFVEECFGLKLKDADFSEENLGGREAIGRFVAQRTGT